MPAPAEPQLELGAVIRELREKRATSQEDLAHAAGVTTGTISAIERGQSNPTWATVKGIAAALDVSMGRLATLVDRRTN